MLSVMTKNATVSITQHNAKCQNYAHDAECHYVECRGAFKGSFPIKNSCKDDLRLPDLLLDLRLIASQGRIHITVFLVTYKRAQ